MKNKPLMSTLIFTVFALVSALLSVGCNKAEPEKPAAAANAPKMAPGQATGMYYMQQNGGGAPAGQQPQQGGR